MVDISREPRPPRRLIVADVMSAPAVTVTSDAPFKEIIDLLRSRRISAVPVVDTDGRSLGIVSEADLLLKEEATGEEPLDAGLRLRRRHALEQKAHALVARDVMSSPAITTTTETRLAAAARSMRTHGLKRLVVVGEEGTVVGVVSRRDILAVFARSDDDIHLDVVEGVLPRWLWVDPAKVTVAVTDGVVDLAGELELRSDTEALLELVQGLEGVVAVRSALGFRFDDRRHPATQHEPLRD